MPNRNKNYIFMLAFVFGVQSYAESTLSIESWRTEDKEVWERQIIPSFEALYPDINVVFNPTDATKYDKAIGERLASGSAGDLITCRPFDTSLALFKKGLLDDLSDLAGLKNFTDEAKIAWTNAVEVKNYCVPIASVIHGFVYNKEIFKALDIKVPTTNDEFFAALDKIKADGKYVPIAMGTADKWEAATMGFKNIGVSYWKGDPGRAKLIWGDAKFTDPEFVAPFEALHRWADYMGEGFQTRSYRDSQNLFTLGRAAIFPSGSWEINGFNQYAHFEMGAFPPPVPKANDSCYITDHLDIGIGLNAASEHKKDARIFLDWIASSEFSNLYTNALSGFYSLSKFPLEVRDPLAKEFLSWREKCKTSIRLTTQLFKQNDQEIENLIWESSADVINGKQTPQAVAQKLQDELDKQ